MWAKLLRENVQAVSTDIRTALLPSDFQSFQWMPFFVLPLVTCVCFNCDLWPSNGTNYIIHGIFFYLCIWCTDNHFDDRDHFSSFMKNIWSHPWAHMNGRCLTLRLFRPPDTESMSTFMTIIQHSCGSPSYSSQRRKSDKMYPDQKSRCEALTVWRWHDTVHWKP